jgi:hypothetical protein
LVGNLDGICANMGLDTEACTELLNQGALPHGDADVSGIGVILAFLISAYVTFFAVFLAYVAGLVDPSLLSAVDVSVFHVRHQQHDPRRKKKYLRKLVLTLSDQQIFTGIAIMSAGFHGLATGGMTVYHFQVVLYLAWMSSSVHLSAVTLLQTYLKVARKRGILVWRLCGMIILMVMLLLGLIPTISNDWGIFYWDGMLPGRTGWAIPAACFWGNLWGDGVGPDAPFGFVILVVSYLWKVGGMFQTTRVLSRRFLKDPVELPLIRMLAKLARVAIQHDKTKRGWAWLWLFRLFLAFVLPILASLEFVSSFAASLWLSLINLAFGTIEIIVPRTQMQPLVEDAESAWGFGQLVPLVLLAQPLGVVSEYLLAPPKPEVLSVSQDEHEAVEGTLAEPEPLPSVARRTLIDVLVDELRPEAPERHQVLRSDVLALLLTSKLFAFIIYLLQLAIAAISAIVLYSDVGTIGNDRSDTWQFIMTTLGFSIAAACLTTIIVAPFSVLGRGLSSRLAYPPRANWTQRTTRVRESTAVNK